MLWGLSRQHGVDVDDEEVRRNAGGGRGAGGRWGECGMGGVVADDGRDVLASWSRYGIEKCGGSENESGFGMGSVWKSLAQEGAGWDARGRARR